jgi:Arc/MetJ-type ribon-helix-helix transcriptional regulator
MALTVRLGPEVERTLRALAKRKRLTRSDVVREAIAHYDVSDAAGDERGRPYSAWVDVVGVVRLGVRDPKRTTGDQFAALLREDTRARRSR